MSAAPVHQEVEASPYDVVRYSPDRRDEVLDLHASGLGWSKNLSARYLRWKYAENPFSSLQRIYLALSQHNAAGMIGVFGGEWEIGDGARLPLACFGDLVVPPEHQSRGVFAAILRHALAELEAEGVTHALSLSAGAPTLLSSLAQGWRGIGSLAPLGLESSREKRPRSPAWVEQTVLRGSRIARSRLAERVGGDRVAIVEERVWGHAFRSFDRASKRGRSSSQVSGATEARPAEMAEIAARSGANGRLRQIRDTRFLSWRFRNPQSRYRFVYADGSELRGYLVLAARRGSSKVTMVDWEADDPDTWRLLLSTALGWGSFDDVHVWSIGLSEETLASFREASFAAAPSDIPGGRLERTVLIRPTRLDPSPEDWTVDGRDLREGSNWDLRMTSSDAY